MERTFASLLAWSVASGAFLCAVYDVLRLLRLRRSCGAAVLFFSDLLYCVFASAVLTVLFFNLTYGRMRALVLALVLVGFLLWRFTVSRAVMAAVNALADALSRLVSRVKLRISVLLRRAYSRGRTCVYIRSTVRSARSCFGMKGSTNERKDTGKDEFNN